MNLLPKRHFLKDLKQLRHERALCQKIEQILDSLETASDIFGMPHLQKMQGHPTAYRIRIGEYRLGLYLEGDGVILARCLHRREIYRYFP